MQRRQPIDAIIIGALLVPSLAFVVLWLIAWRRTTG
jgi:hypothetical protein